MLKRFFDIIFSLLGLVISLPLVLFLGLAILIDNGLPIFYSQKRVGKNGCMFSLYKLRSMKNSSGGAQITVSNDSRITRVGSWLRKLKLDELPQLFNILKGDMSFVGPRPEVQKYVELYSEKQRLVLSVRPGLTGLDSLQFTNEQELLASVQNPHEYYISDIMPKKLDLSLEYIQRQGLRYDFILIIKTIKKVFF